MRGLLVVLSLCLVMVSNLSTTTFCIVVHGFVTATTTARLSVSENTTNESSKRRSYHRYQKNWHRGSFIHSGLDPTSCGRRTNIMVLRAASSNGISSSSFGISNSYLQSLDEQTNNQDDTTINNANQNDEQEYNKTTEETTTKKTGISGHAASQVTYEHTFWGSTCHTKEEIQTFCQQAMENVQEQYHDLILQTTSISSGTVDPLPVVNVLHTDPPLILIEDMLSSNQCESLVRAVAAPEDSSSSSKFQRSTTGASQETSDIRTSTTTWLRENQGTMDSQDLLLNQKNNNDDNDVTSPNNTFNNDNNHHHQLTMRYLSTAVAALTGLPTCHQENLQMIQYTKGQKFETHTDHLDSFNDFHFGGRLATCLVYLNSDNDTSITTKTSSSSPSFSNKIDGSNNSSMTLSTTFTGGETYFPYLDISVRPQRGSALLFWNTKERPGMKHYTPNMFLNVDERLCHSGMPVTNTNGIKWACNRWIHPVDYGAGVRGL